MQNGTISRDREEIGYQDTILSAFPLICICTPRDAQSATLATHLEPFDVIALCI